MPTEVGEYLVGVISAFSTLDCAIYLLADWNGG